MKRIYISDKITCKRFWVIIINSYFILLIIIIVSVSITFSQYIVISYWTTWETGGIYYTNCNHDKKEHAKEQISV